MREFARGFPSITQNRPESGQFPARYWAVATKFFFNFTSQSAVNPAENWPDYWPDLLQCPFFKKKNTAYPAGYEAVGKIFFFDSPVNPANFWPSINLAKNWPDLLQKFLISAVFPSFFHLQNFLLTQFSTFFIFFKKNSP